MTAPGDRKHPKVWYRCAICDRRVARYNTKYCGRCVRLGRNNV